MPRDHLPQRRRSETFTIMWGNFPHVVTVGFYADGRVGECFVTGGKSGETLEAIARDGAVLLSLALQHGVDLATISHAITRDSQNNPSSVIGAVIDRLMEVEHG
ncbi:hypothetical protein I6F35_02990 [Bradyrhizobium sp. BRP22]|uniref:TSCPD domain-containing protein n=1 Tax=Bradyrhizobium sp. BRP22 TaxID=2793821 RepID=UPI001CD1EB21|nr:hypothetical protein [Bradyrhizobium sp. BRP22]MCA1452181.1 hypothetical protein [Bradyrhizobium sp. BRP22]